MYLLLVLLLFSVTHTVCCACTVTEVSAIEGDHLVLQCTSSSEPTWNPTANVSNILTTSLNNNNVYNSWYIINNVTSAVVTCENQHGACILKFNITAYAKPNAATISGPGYSEVTHPVSLSCASIGGRPAEEFQYEWELNGHSINLVSKNYEIQSISSAQGGRYTCRVSNYAGSSLWSSGHNIVVGMHPPQITSLAEIRGRLRILTNERITLRCNSTADVPREWRRNNQYYQNTQSAELEIVGPSNEVNIKYSCKVSNGSGMDTDSIYIQFVDPRIEMFEINGQISIHRQSFTFHILLGSNHRLTCLANNIDTTLLLPGGSQVDNTFQKTNFTEIDSGNYTCYFEDAVNSISVNISVTVVIYELPTLFASTSQTVTEGNETTIWCLAIQDPDSPDDISFRIHLTGPNYFKSVESPTFVINNTISASRNHNGEFYCKVYIIQAGTETLVKTVSFSLSVNFPPESVTIYPKNATLNFDSDRQFTCTSSARPSSNYTFDRTFPNGTITSHSNDINIEPLSKEELGENVITCNAYNEAGSNTDHVNLTIIDKPDKVNATQIMAFLDETGINVTLNWTQPQDNYAVIYDYRIMVWYNCRSNINCFDSNTTVKKNEVVIPNNESLPFRVRIAAKNEVGLGEFSDPFIYLPPVVVSSNSGNSGGPIAGIVAGTLIALLLATGVFVLLVIIILIIRKRKRKNLENCKEKPNSQFENECKIDNSGTILPLDSAYQPLEMEDVRNQGYQATIFKSSHPDNYNDYALPEAVVHTNKANKPGDPKLSRNQYANIHGEASQKTDPSDGYITMDEAMGRNAGITDHDAGYEVCRLDSNTLGKISQEPEKGKAKNSKAVKYPKSFGKKSIKSSDVANTVGVTDVKGAKGTTKPKVTKEAPPTAKKPLLPKTPDSANKNPLPPVVTKTSLTPDKKSQLTAKTSDQSPTVTTTQASTGPSAEHSGVLKMPLLPPGIHQEGVKKGQPKQPILPPSASGPSTRGKSGKSPLQPPSNVKK